MNRFTRRACCAAALPLVFVCGPTRLAGPATEQGNPQIVAVVVDGAGKPVAGATVVAYHVPDNGDSTLQPSSAFGVAEQQTDARGSCSFSDIVPGNYSLAATDSVNNRSALRPHIYIAEVKPLRPEFSDTLVIAAPGSVEGVVSRGGIMGTSQNQNLKDAFIQVKIGEIDRATITGPGGNYFFGTLPSGVYTIYYYATDGFYSARRENIAVTPGAVKEIDTVILRPVPRLMPPKGFGAVYDTAARIVNLYWNKVVYDSLRWYQVTRIVISTNEKRQFICQDTVLRDTLASMPSGTLLNYVVCSVDRAFNESANAGPLEIRVQF